MDNSPLPIRGPLSVDPSRQCTAHSSQTGERCKKAAIKGGNVCAAHGGRAPQVKRKARERLDALVLPAIKILNKAIRNAEKSSSIDDLTLAVRAALNVLDRTGYGSKVEIEGNVTIEGGRLPLEDISVEGKRQIIEILERERVLCGAKDVTSRELPPA